MCGIVVLENAQLRSDEISQRASLALDAQFRRGPDGRNFQFVKPTAVMGFNLLGLNSTNPERLMQPISSENGDWVVVVNGEIYNFQEIKSRIEPLGIKFKSESDCEVIAQGLQLWGPRFLNQLDGEFAFVAYCHSLKKWLCGVDKFGTKPIKYFLKQNEFAVASSVAGLKSLGIEIQFDMANLMFHLRNYVPRIENTIFKNIRTLPPGSYMEVSSNFESTVTSYTDNSKNEDFKNAYSNTQPPVLQWIEQSLLKKVPRFHQLALSLSGGIDSGLLAILLKKWGIPFTSFSIVFPNDSFSEKGAIQSFCNRHDIQTNYIPIDEDNLITYFPESIQNAEALAINTHTAGKLILNKAIQTNGFRVCLTGDGADEIFLGYKHFYQDDPYHFVKEAYLNYPIIDGLIDKNYRQIFSESDLSSDQGQRSKLLPEKLYAQYWFNHYGLKTLGDSQAATQSLEYRYPFLSNQIFDWWTGSDNLLNQNRPSKQILRQIAGNLDPKLSVEPKRPFISPLITKKWLPLFEEYLLCSETRKLDLFDDSAIENYLQRLHFDQKIEMHKTSSIVLTMLLSVGILNRRIIP